MVKGCATTVGRQGERAKNRFEIPAGHFEESLHIHAIRLEVAGENREGCAGSLRPFSSRRLGRYVPPVTKKQMAQALSGTLPGARRDFRPPFPAMEPSAPSATTSGGATALTTTRQKPKPLSCGDRSDWHACPERAPLVIVPWIRYLALTPNSPPTIGGWP